MMASAFFLNSTPFHVTLNFNASKINRQLIPMPPTTTTTPPVQDLPATPFPISRNKAANVFGVSEANRKERNVLIVISEGFSMPQVWYITSTVSPVLDLYFYIFDNAIYGVDNTGGTKDIIVRQADIGAQMLLASKFPTILMPKKPL